MTIIFREKENDGHRQSSNNVFDDCPWPSFHKYGMTSHDHHFLNFSKITPFFGQNFGSLEPYRVWYTCWNTYESSESKFITKKLKIITNNPEDSIQHHALSISKYPFSFTFIYYMLWFYKSFWGCMRSKYLEIIAQA